MENWEISILHFCFVFSMSSCPQCSYSNASGAKFCNECGAPLSRVCPACNHKNEPNAKFCNECGTNLLQAAQKPAPQLPDSHPQLLTSTFTAPAIPSLSGERRRATVLFADLSGSTALGEKFDAEDVFEVMNACFAGLTQIIERQGGFVVKYIGDCIMALFGAPVAHGDDPQRAVRAALEMQVWLTDFSRDLEARKGVPFLMRIGLNFGHVIAGGVGGYGTKAYDVLGDTVNVAQRLESIAEPGAVFVSEAVRRLTAREFVFGSEGRVRVKGRAEEIEVFRVLGPREQVPEALNSDLLIGREHELQVIAQAFENLGDQSSNGRLIILSGEAGIGKTRLLESAILQASERDVSVHFTSCAEREAARPFALVRQLLLHLCGLSETASSGEKVEQLTATLAAFPTLNAASAPWLPALQTLLAPENVSPSLDEETRKNLIVQGVVEIYRALCQEAPRLLLVDDAQWLDESSSAALNALAREVLPHTRLLILVAHWPGWSHDWPEEANQQKCKLNGLNEEQCRQLIENLIGAALPPTVITTLVTRSGGNPYYLREVLQELIEAGHLQRQNESWQASATLGDFVVPDSIYGALVARLDRLDVPARSTLQNGAVAGLEFPFRLLEVLSPEIKSSLPTTLRRLETLEFLVEAEPPPQWISRFRHAAMREVAYDALLLAERKTRHAQIAIWLEETYRGREVEAAAHLAHHHTKAGQSLRAAHFGMQAGHEARSLFANADALRFFEQALALLDDSEQARTLSIEAHAGIGEVQTRLGNFETAIAAWQSALDGLNTAFLIDKQAKVRGAYFLRKLAFCQSEIGADEKAQAFLRSAFRALQKENSVEAQRERSFIVGDRAFMLYRQGRFAQAWRLGRWSYALAEQAGGEDERCDAANLLGVVAQAQGRIDEALGYYAQSQNAAQNCGDLSAAASAINNLGTVHFHAGRFEEAEKSWMDALQAWQKIGDSVEQAQVLNNIGHLHLARGDFNGALAQFGKARARFHSAKHRFGEAATLAVSGEAHLENQNISAALESLRAAQILACELDALDLLAYSGTTLAVALLEAGENQEAEREGQAALELSRSIGNPVFEGIARRTLGRLALKRDDIEEAEHELLAALELFTQNDLRPEQGRTFLALAQWHRAANRLDESEQCRTQALKIFEEIGAEADAQRARET